MGDRDGNDALGDDLAVLPDGGDEGGHAHGVGRLHCMVGRGERETTRLSTSLNEINKTGGKC